MAARLKTAYKMAKETGKFALEPYYSVIRGKPYDPVRAFSSPITRNLLLVTGAELVSLAATGKPIENTGRLNDFVQSFEPYVLGVAEGFAEGAMLSYLRELAIRRKR